MRKLGVAAVCGLLAAVAVPAIAQSPTPPPGVKVAAKVTPGKAGTRRHPQGVTLNTTINWEQLGSAAQPIVQTFDVLFPKGSLYGGAHLKSCSYNRLNAGGPKACPKASIVGSGTGNAYADTVITHPKITVVNGGKNKIFFFTVLNNPARVQSPVVGTITKMSGKYSYKLHVVVPGILQVVAGVPIELTQLHVTVGKGSYLSTTSCGPGGKWPFSITTGYNTGGSASDTASIPCRK
jgi:hypothetical protein